MRSARELPIPSLILCLVLVAVSFLPLGSMGAFPLRLDNSWISPWDMKVPMWVVPALAAFVALFLVLRGTHAWTPPRPLCPALAGAALVISGWMTFVLIGSEETNVGSGAIAMVVASGALLVSTLRDRPAARSDFATA
jgi:hypothetical protein